MSLPCSLSAIYLGIVVLDDLQNRQRYEQTIKELTLFLKTHHNEINLDIDDRWVRLRSLEGQNEVNIPLNCANLRTIYYRISMESIEDENSLRRFCEIAWECCCILKENFPSRIELFQENLDQFVNIEEETFQLEMLRRQTNSLLNKLALHEQLKRDEIQDIFKILENSMILKNLKGVKACLELLESELCPPCLLQQIHSNDVELLENIDSSDGSLRQSLESELLVREYSDIRSLASSILCKILRAQNNGGASFDGCKENLGVVNYLKKFEVSNFSQPASKHSYLFQLKESSDIERITFILDTLLQNNLNLLDELDSIGLPQIVAKLLYKYSEGDFGIDFSEVTQYCVFHNRILKYILRLIQLDDASAVTPILSPETAPALLQIIEEGILNILKNTVNLDTKEKYEKELFIRQSLEFYQDLLSQQSLISDNFKRLLRTHFISVRDVTNSYLGIGQPEDLSAVPRDFRHFYVTISGLIDKVDYSLTRNTMTVNNKLDHQEVKTLDGNCNGNNYLSYTKYRNQQNSSSQNIAKNTQLTNSRTLPKENQLKNEKITTNMNLPRQQQQEKLTPNNSAILKSNRNVSPPPFSPNSDKSSSRIKLQQQKPNPFLPRQVPLDYQGLSEGEKEDCLDDHDENTFQDQPKDIN